MDSFLSSRYGGFCSSPTRLHHNRLRPNRQLLLLSLPLLSLVVTSPILAAPFQKATVVEMINGRQVYINSKPASRGQEAGRGSVIQTKNSSARLQFDQRAAGLMGRDSLIKLGAACFQLDRGKVVVNGKQKTCFGSSILAIDGTTYLIGREPDQSYTVDLLAGDARVSRAPASIDTLDTGESTAGTGNQSDGDGPNILSTYPRVAPWVGATAGGFGSAYPSGGGSFTGGLSYFQPMAQSGAKQLLYTSASVGSSFQDIWGFSTEVGYRWLTPAIQSTNSAYLGYSGYGAPGCYTNMLNGGAQWERARWRLGASGGLKLNECSSSFNYAALNLSIPVGQINTRPAYFSISPYLLNGNIVSTDLLESDTNPDSFPGLRLSLELPITPSLTVKGYGGADSVFGVSAGGQFILRIPSSTKLIKAPNVPPVAPRTAAAGSLPIALASATTSLPTATAPPALLAFAAPAAAPTSDQPAGLFSPPAATTLGQGAAPIVIQQGQRGRFSPDGDLLSIEPISNREFLQLLITNFKGHAPLPESHRIARIAQQRGILSPQVAGVLGTDFLANASQSISATLDTPFSPLTQMPAGRFVCAATKKARMIGAEEAEKGQFDYSGGPAYFGKGSETSQGYPATYNKSDAFVFADAGVCRELNRLADQGYDVVEAEPI